MCVCTCVCVCVCVCVCMCVCVCVCDCWQFLIFIKITPLNYHNTQGINIMNYYSTVIVKMDFIERCFNVLEMMWMSKVVPIWSLRIVTTTI